MYVVGLAPAANGGNRTGRIFTGDRSGDWLFGTLFEVGLANRPDSVSRNDGLRVTGVYIGAAVRCAPPGNKPTPAEFQDCSTYLQQEFVLLPRARVIVALGSLAYNAIKKLLKPEIPSFRFTPFAHGAKSILPDGRVILCSYHPSQQNTFTGKLTHPMFLKIFRDAKKLASI